jgi:glycosyltransferase involved in cell wall biosynthesis
MKILHAVQSYTPAANGMQEVVRQVSERLVMWGHEVTVATTAHAERRTNIFAGVNIEEFSILGNAIGGYQADSSEIRRYQSFLRSDFDVVTAFAAQQWAADIALEMLDSIYAKTVFVPTGFSRLNDSRYGAYFKNMRTWMKNCNMNVFLSYNYQDISFAKRHGIKNYSIIPNGADEREFLHHDNKANIRQQLGIPGAHTLILHVGSHTGMKGHFEAMHIFAQTKTRNATLLMIGKEGPANGCSGTCRTIAASFNASESFQSDNKQILLADLPRNEIVSAYINADIFLFPSNIECSPIVLFEACASKTPFLSTDTGNSREIAKWTGGGVILPTCRIPWHLPREAAKKIIRTVLYPLGFPVSAPKNARYADIGQSARQLKLLINDKVRRSTLAETGYQMWKEKFTWDNIARQYEKLYQSLLS